MSVKLIHATDDGDSRIAYIARVSSSDQSNPDAAKLIGYLIRHGHWSPFEMVSVAIEIETTRDIGRQLLRHRSFSFQEFSQRYAEVAEINLDRELRFKGTTNRQGSRVAALKGEINVADEYAELMAETAQACFKLYQSMISAGIAPECARAILPEGMTPTRMYMHGTLRSWIHFLKERLKRNEHGVRLAQKECAEIAIGCYVALQMNFPQVFTAIDRINYLELADDERLVRIGGERLHPNV
jgi:thymidylate synthase (FAD)